MSIIGEVLGGHHEFTHKGKTYKVSLITQEVKLAYERKLFNKAKEAAKAMKELMPATEYLEYLDRLNQSYLDGEFTIEGTRGAKHLTTVGGMCSLIALLFGTDEAEALKLVKDRETDVATLLKVIYQESFGISDAEIAEAESKVGRQNVQIIGEDPQKKSWD